MPSDIKLTVATERKVIKEQFLIAQEGIIECANCKKALLNVLQGTGNETIVTFILVECPYCGDSSFKTRVKGKIYIQAANGLTMSDMPLDIIDGIRHTTIKVTKNG